MGADKTTIRCVGAKEAQIKALIERAQAFDGGQIAYCHTRRYAEDVIELTYGENISKRLAEDVLRVFAEGLEESIYSLDDTSLPKQLVWLLKLCAKNNVRFRRQRSIF